ALGAARPDQLGDYRIIREVGRGGMGIVYEAEQVSLGRHVAVKVLPKELLANPKHRSRFQREAKAAAKLHHTNIVPVFGVGEENGLGYYVMQFIQGLALDAVLDELKRMKLRPGSSGVTVEAAGAQARRRDVSAADVARSLLDGEFRSLAADEPPLADEPRRIDETVDHEPGDVEQPPGAGFLARHASSGAAPQTAWEGRPTPDDAAGGDGLGSPSSWLSDTLSGSNPSVVLSGSSGGTEKRNRRWTYWQSVAHIGVQVAEALHYAHGQGILHRDIKPSNLLLDLGGTVWVTDFGLAKLDDDRGLTQTGDILGTLRYLAPETLKGRADARSETYSLGLTLYELLALRPAVEPTSRHAIIDQVLSGQVEPLAKRNPEIPRDLQTIVHKAIERDPKHRYPTAQELADDLRRFIDDEPIHARRLSTFEHVVRWSRHNKGLAASLAAVGVLVCVLAVGSTIAAGYFRSVNGRLSNTVQSLKTTQVELHDKVDALDVATGEAQKKAAENLRLANVAQRAERRSREFRYATDVQLAARLLADADANATQVLARLSDHDPTVDQALRDGGDRPSPAATDSPPRSVGATDDLRGFEWHYLKRLIDSRAAIFPGGERPVVDNTLTPEGEFVTLDDDGQVRRWDAKTRRETRPTLDLKQGRYLGASKALSPDGRRAALAFNGTVLLLDTATGKEVTRPLPTAARFGLIFSPDSRMLIAADDTVGWWNASTGKPIAVADAKLSGAGPLSISSDGLTLAVGRQRGEYSDASFSVFRMNPDAREVTTLQDKHSAGMGSTRALALTPDGKSLAVSQYYSGNVALFDTTTGRRLNDKFFDHASSVSAIGFNAEGDSMVTASVDGSIKVWTDYKAQYEATSGKTTAPQTTALTGHTGQVTCAGFALDGKQVISSSNDKTSRIWNLTQATASLHQAIEGIGGMRARFSPDGLLMALAEPGNPRLRDAATGRPVREFLRPHNQHPQIFPDSVAFSPDSRLLAVGYGGAKDVSHVELWDIDGGERLADLPGTTDIPNFTTDEFGGIVAALAFSPDGRFLAAGFGSLNSFSSGNQGPHPLKVYDVAARRTVRVLEGHEHYCPAIAFSRDGGLMASASYDGTARIWYTATWKTRHVLSNPDPSTTIGWRRVFDVAFSPTAELLAMASHEGNVHIWNAATGQLVQTLRGHANGVWCVAFSPDGRTLASGSYDNTVRLWNVATWRELVRLDTENSAPPRALEFSSDGTRLLAARFPVTIWSTQPNEEGAPEQLAEKTVQSPKFKFRGFRT
ncbi:MAG TPA: protein kinase, partial [Pirellulales bacterium]|nr:protein kinase [Pirellulales bacterium]